MSNSVPLKVVLILLALIPIAVWAYTAYGFGLSYWMAELGSRKTGQAAAILLMILLGLTPAFIGGICMIVGASLLGRRPLGGRITATIGIALVAVSAAVALAFEGELAYPEMLMGGIAYILLHLALLAWLWRGRRAAAL
jgi:hypothetical protein